MHFKPRGSSAIVELQKLTDCNSRWKISSTSTFNSLHPAKDKYCLYLSHWTNPLICGFCLFAIGKFVGKVMKFWQQKCEKYDICFVETVQLGCTCFYLGFKEWIRRKSTHFWENQLFECVSWVGFASKVRESECGDYYSQGKQP